MAIRAYQYRLYPTKTQEEALQVKLDVSPHVYNMVLEGKREGYLLAKQYKKTFPQSKLVNRHVLPVAIEDLDRAFQAFFRRLKAGEEPGSLVSSSTATASRSMIVG